LDRELLIELGVEEIPAGWLPGLTRQLAQVTDAQVKALRLDADAKAETHSTPRRLAVFVSRLAERQTDLEELVNGPPASGAAGPDGRPTPAAAGFAKKYGVAVDDLERVETPKGVYLAYRKRQRGKATVDALPDVLVGILRGLSFPRHMHWDAWLEDGRGELTFGRPIRWMLFLYGGRVVPFEIRRSENAAGPLVQDVRSGAVTYGHRFLTTSGRAGRAVKVKTFDDYRARLLEHFVILDREERRERIGRELELHARRLNGRVHRTAAAQSGLLDEVPDLVEYPSVVAGTFAAEFLDLPEEVLTTTMIHHQHWFPVTDDAGKLKPAFLAVTNIAPERPELISRNAERVLTARLRDARFFWDADRRVPLEDRIERLGTILFHKRLGTYREKTDRMARLARICAEQVFEAPEAADDAVTAARLAKADLATDMVREFTELQGTMGGIYARAEGKPEPVWKAIYYQYLPIGLEAEAPPTRGQLGAAAVPWASLSLADKLDTLVGSFAAGDRPTGSRDPFGLRRQILEIVAEGVPFLFNGRSALDPALRHTREHGGRALQGCALHVMVHAAHAAEFLAAAGTSRSAMDHVRHRRAMTGLLLGTVAVDQHQTAVERADAEDEVGCRGGIIGVEGGHEAAVAAIGQGHGLIETVIAHYGADRAEGLDAMHVGGADRVWAMQQERRNEGAALPVRALDREVVRITNNDIGLCPQLRHLREHIAALSETDDGSHADALELGIADLDLGKPLAQSLDHGRHMRIGGNGAPDRRAFLACLDRHLLRDLLDEEIEFRRARSSVRCKDGRIERVALGDEAYGFARDHRMTLQLLGRVG
jgi:glycyl-tRNA synthetase beta chain